MVSPTPRKVGETMLTVSRKAGESICIGPDVRVCISRVRGNKVELNINAPANVAVNRGEVANLKGILVPIARRNSDVHAGPPRGVFRDGWLCQIGDTLMWSPNENLSQGVDISRLFVWRFSDDVEASEQIVRVGPEAER